MTDLDGPIQQRGGLAADWIIADPVLLYRELGWETDTGKSKLGDGVTLWSALPYRNLVPAENLADLEDAADARTNLGLGTAALLISDTDTGLAANSDGRVATQKAGKAYADAWGAYLTGVIGAYAPLASPALTGNPTAPTPSAADNDTSIATTAFVQGEISTKAPLASPALTGNPTAPTPSAGDNDTSVATTAFVTAALSKQAEVFTIALSDETSPLTTGLKVTWRVPFPFTCTEIRTSLTGSGSTATTIDVKEAGTTVLSTKPSMGSGVKTSLSGTAAVISDASWANDAEMTFFIDAAGTGATGAKVTLIGTRT